MPISTSKRHVFMNKSLYLLSSGTLQSIKHFTHWIRKHDPWNWPAHIFACLFQSWHEMCPGLSHPYSSRLCIWWKTCGHNWQFYSFLSDLSLASEILGGTQSIGWKPIVVWVNRRTKRTCLKAQTGPRIIQGSHFQQLSNSDFLFRPFCLELSLSALTFKQWLSLFPC